MSIEDGAECFRQTLQSNWLYGLMVIIIIVFNYQHINSQK